MSNTWPHALRQWCKGSTIARRTLDGALFLYVSLYATEGIPRSCIRKRQYRPENNVFSQGGGTRFLLYGRVRVNI